MPAERENRQASLLSDRHGFAPVDSTHMQIDDGKRYPSTIELCEQVRLAIDRDERVTQILYLLFQSRLEQQVIDYGNDGASAHIW